VTSVAEQYPLMSASIDHVHCSRFERRKRVEARPEATVGRIRRNSIFQPSDPLTADSIGTQDLQLIERPARGAAQGATITVDLACKGRCERSAGESSIGRALPWPAPWCSNRVTGRSERRPRPMPTADSRWEVPAGAGLSLRARRGVSILRTIDQAWGSGHHGRSDTHQRAAGAGDAKATRRDSRGAVASSCAAVARAVMASFREQERPGQFSRPALTGDR